MVTNKSLFYHANGSGRDTYIYNPSGGFYPEKSPVKIEDLGKLKFYLFLFLGSFVIQKNRHRNHFASIHSKPVNYTNNGSGRDTYISDSAGGLKTMY